MKKGMLEGEVDWTRIFQSGLQRSNLLYDGALENNFVTDGTVLLLERDFLSFRKALPSGLSYLLFASNRRRELFGGRPSMRFLLRIVAPLAAISPGR